QHHRPPLCPYTTLFRSRVRVARAGIQEFERLLDTGFRRYDGEDLNDLFNKLWFQDTSAVFLTASCALDQVPFRDLLIPLRSIVNPFSVIRQAMVPVPSRLTDTRLNESLSESRQIPYNP